ncbi:MAG: Hsp20/alpha crystallin family protein [bacterium]
MLTKFNPMRALLPRDPFFDDFFDAAFPVPQLAFEPKIDVKESEKEFVINAELPGLEKNDFKLVLENDVLTLEGEKKYEHEEKKDEYYRSERSYGSFRRSFRLTNEVEKNKIKADYKNGILKITIPKSQKALPKQVEINVS